MFNIMAKLRENQKLRIISAAIVIFCLMMINTSYADIIKRRGLIERVHGRCDIYSDIDGAWVKATKGLKVHEKDIIRTGEAAYVDVRIRGQDKDESDYVRVKENSEMTLEKLAHNKASGAKETILNLAIGTVLIKASKLDDDSKFEVYTPTSMVAVRGTIFEVNVAFEQMGEGANDA